MKRRVISAILSIILCISVFPSFAMASRDVSFEESLAQDLKGLGLFKGVSETNFDLERAPTRLEALVMLIRVLGKENEALSGNWYNPFKDVPPWAEKYVGYAYEKGLTNGISSTEFGLSNAAANIYLTFMLRALGYSDVNGKDFQWYDPFALARDTGILPDRVNTTNFWRADVVTVSYAALQANIKGSQKSLAQKLIEAGAFTTEAFNKHYDANAIANASEYGKELNAQEVYEACSPAVFYIKTFDVEGNPYATGSGFFVTENGFAVTNHHVLENALSAKAVLTDGRELDISGVLYFNDEADFAVIKINGTGFKYLKAGNSDTIRGGERVYAIGNPRGLTNTISDGIVSNPYREDFGGMIQITAPISPGSSGGALINSKGEVIGVTTAYLASGQNLNFAVPINTVLDEESLDAFEQKHGLLSMKDYAAYNEYLTYNSIPGAFSYIVSEIEPNNSYDTANIIENGMSVSGRITDEFLDVFLVYCNTVGRIDITLFSDSPARYVKDILLVSEPVKKAGNEGVKADYYTFSDGTVARQLTYFIPKPGIYAICLLSNQLCYYEYLNTDYTFYYCFTPGATSGANTTGAEHFISG